MYVYDLLLQGLYIQELYTQGLCTRTESVYYFLLECTKHICAHDTRLKMCTGCVSTLAHQGTNHNVYTGTVYMYRVCR